MTAWPEGPNRLGATTKRKTRWCCRLIQRLVAERPTYGYRRITAVLNRLLRAEELAPVNHKRVYRIIKDNTLLLARQYTERFEQSHDGKVIVMRSNLRWCSDGFGFTCWEGDVVRGTFLIDAHDREITSWRAVVNAGSEGDTAIGPRARPERPGGARHDPGSRRAALRDLPSASPPLAPNGQRGALHRQGDAHLCPATRPAALLHPGEKPTEQWDVRELLNTLKRDDVRVTPLPDAATALRLRGDWFSDYNENHPHSGPKWPAPRDFIAAQTETA